MSRTSKAHWIAAAALMALPALASAQGYYDDDIYYNPSKDKQAAKPTATVPATYTPAAQSYAPADTYVFNTGSTFNVDDYNRRGQFLVSDTTYADTTAVDYFANTRRIERFHNSDVVVNSGDDALISYYYTQPSTINIYVDNDPWYFPRWSWSWAYTNPLYNWSWGYYDPWWNPVWGWSWSSYWGPGWGPSWSWGWGPSWAWGWGPGWRPGWYPGWGPGWHPGHGPGHGPGWHPGHGSGNHWAYRPTGIGSSRPHAYTNGTSSRNPGSAQGTIRPGQATRPTGGIANTGRPSTASGSNATATRPGTGTQHVTTVPAGSVTPSYGSNTGTRGRNNYGSGSNNNNSNRGSVTNSGANRGNSNSYNSNRQNNNNNNYNSNRNNNSNNNRNSYNSNSGSSNTGRSGYSGGGGSRGGNSGGGSRSTGGGGGRGRR